MCVCVFSGGISEHVWEAWVDRESRRVFSSSRVALFDPRFWPARWEAGFWWFESLRMMCAVLILQEMGALGLAIRERKTVLRSADSRVGMRLVAAVRRGTVFDIGVWS
jgi:hypothetical protein